MRHRSGIFLTFFVLLFSVLRVTPHAFAQHQSAEGVHSVDTLSGHAGANDTHGGPSDVHGHDVSNYTPREEMMAILEHKVENTSYIHEWPFPMVQLPTDWVVNVAGMSINMSPTRHLVYMWISVLLTVLLSVLAARQNAGRAVPRGFGNMIEATVVFVRDEVVAPFLGHDTRRYLPLLLTFFFFIATMNLVGLLPFGAASTGNIAVTAGLSLITFGLMLGGGMRANGVFGYLKGIVPHGLPWPLYIIMIPIEVMGMFTKPFALTVRLFANMVSGGLVIGAFYALIFGLDTVAVAPLSLVFLLFMSLLKIFVCLLQAYIFTMLSAFFIGMSVHQSH